MSKLEKTEKSMMNTGLHHDKDYDKMMQNTLKNNTAMKTKVCLFGRVSTDLQDFQRQVSDLTKVAERNNWEIVEIITEKISGAKSNSERNGIQELTEKATAGLFQKVLVTEISRLGRSPKDVLATVEFLTSKGISLYVQDLNIETLDSNGKSSFMSELLVSIMSLFSKNEREVLRTRIKSGMKQAEANGIVCHRPVGTTETKEEILAKYPKAVKDIKAGLSVRKVCKLHDLAQGTVMKLRKILAAENQLPQAA